MDWDRIEKNLKAHRDEAKITCGPDCWCWDMEILCDVYGPSDDVLGETLKRATKEESEHETQTTGRTMVRLRI